MIVIDSGVDDANDGLHAAGGDVPGGFGADVGALSRIQVKSAIGREFKVPLLQLRKRLYPDLYYIFTVHHGGFWYDFLILKRKALAVEHDEQEVGTVADGRVVIRIAYTAHDVICKGRSLQQYREAWTPWPLIQH